MGQIFSSAALSPFLMQFTIHRREQIAAHAVTALTQHKHRNCVEICSPFLILAERLWQILSEVTVLKIGNIDDQQAFYNCLLKAEFIKNAKHVWNSGITYKSRFYLSLGSGCPHKCLHKSHHLGNINDTTFPQFTDYYSGYTIYGSCLVRLVFCAGAYHLMFVMPCANTGLHSPISFILAIY